MRVIMRFRFMRGVVMLVGTVFPGRIVLMDLLPSGVRMLMLVLMRMNVLMLVYADVIPMGMLV